MRGPKGRFERLIVKGVLWVGLGLLMLFAVFLAGATWEVYQKEQGARTELNAAELALEELQEREEKLSHDLEALQSERGMEAEFRERFPVVKSGEEVIVLVDAPESTQESSGASQRGFWGAVKSWFGF